MHAAFVPEEPTHMLRQRASGKPGGGLGRDGSHVDVRLGAHALVAHHNRGTGLVAKLHPPGQVVHVGVKLTSLKRVARAGTAARRSLRHGGLASMVAGCEHADAVT